ncbi:hypothetical protein [Allonocardiopsis opalescens]|uniref:SCO6045-like C-terminal domain-containing protein n=1 Tax=Allonocardiopsis opalescens TaxID=1144618 RepID=A0A2T0Q529_9ACTN|nr:hypothetical protein [Allonocardiopsis opalescens]PRX98870.1 hypothetical protein CLV72_104450 [Allonocardiopsis opalescens]
MSAPSDGGRAALAAAQERLLRALVAGAEAPDGFDRERLAVAARALLRKRAAGVARAWPRLAHGYGERWPEVFAEWAAARPTAGAWRDGWDFARAHRAALPPPAARELAGQECRWRYDGAADPRPRRGPALRRVPGGVVVGLLGRTAAFVRDAPRDR